MRFRGHFRWRSQSRSESFNNHKALQPTSTADSHVTPPPTPPAVSEQPTFTSSPRIEQKRATYDGGLPSPPAERAVASYLERVVRSAARPVLFDNATIISYDEVKKRLKVLRHASLLVQDGRIVAITDNRPQTIEDDVEVVDATNKIISPGFINTHHHMWQTAFRTMAADTTLMEYFARYGQTATSKTVFGVDDVFLGQLASALEMIDCGTTTVLDHAHGTFSDEHVDAVVDADVVSGLRIIHAHGVDPFGATGWEYEKSLGKLQSLMHDKRFDDGPLELGLAYDGFAFAPPERSMEVMDAVIKHNNQVHESGTGTAVTSLTSHFVAGPYGATNSPQVLNSMPASVIKQDKFSKKLPIILSHASFMDNKDAVILRQNPHVTISTTPESESHYGHTSTGADQCQDCASLGVDTHFTFSAYMPFQARLWLQQMRLKHYTSVSRDGWEAPINNPMTAEDAFMLMTKKGADALGRDDLGVIKVGAQADLVMFDCSRPGLWASRDPIAAIVLHTGGGGDVESVMVQGKWLKKNHKIISPMTGPSDGLEVEDVKRRFEESARRIQDQWEKMERPKFEVGKDTGYGLAKFGRCKEVSVMRDIAAEA